MAYLILFMVIAALSILATDKGCGIKCFSFSCRYNKRGRCGRKDIAIYDNTVTGLCLYHTDDMKERILEAMKKGRLLDRYEHETYMVTKTLKKPQGYISDEECLKNPNVFTKWIKRHLQQDMCLTQLIGDITNFIQSAKRKSISILTKICMTKQSLSVTKQLK